MDGNLYQLLFNLALCFGLACLGVGFVSMVRLVRMLSTRVARLEDERAPRRDARA